MRRINRIAGALRYIGVALLIIAVALSIYNVSTSSASWGNFRTRLSQLGLPTGIIDRFRFDTDYFGALSEAAGNSALPSDKRSAAVKEHFAGFSAPAAAKEAQLQESELEGVIAYFDGEFDRAGYREIHEQAENQADQIAAREVIEFLDSLNAPPKGKGGKLAGLKAASCEPDVAAFYESYAAEHGEAAGTYLEFLRTVEKMIRADQAAGGSTIPAKSWLETRFDAEAYQQALIEVQAEEHAETSSFLDEFAAWAEGNGSFRDFLTAQQAKLQERYPNRNVTNTAALATAMRTVIDAGTAFDGSPVTLLDTYKDTVDGLTKSGYDAFLDEYAGTVVASADERSKIGIIGPFWAVCSAWMWLWIAAIVLIILSFVVRRLMNDAMVRKAGLSEIQEDPDILLQVDHLKQYFRSGPMVTKAVDDVSFYIRKGEVFGLVGESGCGKTTTGRTIINLYDPTDGTVTFHGLHISSTQNGVKTLVRSLRQDFAARVKGMKASLDAACKKEPDRADELRAKYREDVARMRRELNEEIDRKQLDALKSAAEKERAAKIYRERQKKALTEAYTADMKTLSGAAAEERTARYKMELKAADRKNSIMTRMQMIFQDPIASINPRMTVREIIAEGLTIRGIRDKKYIDEKVYEMLDLVGLVREHADRYPHEFSGGQRQRIGIARAIVMEPELIIADEPISALDVSIQAQVINLLNDLRNNMGLTILFIAHNLSVVKYFSDRIAVMYYGHLVEMADSEELFRHPLHPYTISLLSAIPYPDPHYEKQRQRISYDPDKAHDYSQEGPTLREITPGHFIRCNTEEYERYRKELGL